MVKITYRPWDEIVIHEILEYNPQELFLLLVRQALGRGAAGIIPTINWVDGVVFVINIFPDTEEIVREKLKGIIHYGAIQFALFPEHKPLVKVKVGASEHEIRLDKAESNPIFVELAKFLKEKAQRHFK